MKWSVYNLYVYLNSKRKNHNNKIQKNAFENFYKFNVIKVKMWSSINQQDFCLPGVFYTGKEHSLKGNAHNLSLLPV